jgi:hypothetical protein
VVITSTPDLEKLGHYFTLADFDEIGNFKNRLLLVEPNKVETSAILTCLDVQVVGLVFLRAKKPLHILV